MYPGTVRFETFSFVPGPPLLPIAGSGADPRGVCLSNNEHADVGVSEKCSWTKSRNEAEWKGAEA